LSTRLSIMSSPEDAVVRVQTERLRELLRWREYLPHLVEAVEKVLGEEVKVYVMGSAVEGKLTVDSDIDAAAIVKELPKSGLERARILSDIWREMERRGVPWWYPFEIHLMTREEFEILEKGKALKVRCAAKKARTAKIDRSRDADAC